jgi:hypothetical protein
MLNIGADLEDYHEYYRLSNKDYYYDLHLEHDATKEQIKIAFKELALRLHLDKNNGDKRAENAFKRVSEPAFHPLSCTIIQQLLFASCYKLVYSPAHYHGPPDSHGKRSPRRPHSTRSI